MGRRVNITDLARATHTSTSSWRTWLEQPGFPLEVEYGGYRGGTSEKRGRVRYLDFDEAVAWLERRGGAQVEESVLPHEQLELLRAEITALTKRMQRLEELLLSGGYRPALASRAAPLGERQHERLPAQANDDDSYSDDDTTPVPPVRLHRPSSHHPPSDKTSSSSRSDREPLPDYLQSCNSVADDHKIPHRTVRNAHNLGLIRFVREPKERGWKLEHGYVIEAYDDDGIDDFHTNFHDRETVGIPCRTCGYIPRALRARDNSAQDV